jgi:hypothetical protein
MFVYLNGSTAFIGVDNCAQLGLRETVTEKNMAIIMTVGNFQTLTRSLTITLEITSLARIHNISIEELDGYVIKEINGESVSVASGEISKSYFINGTNTLVLEFQDEVLFESLRDSYQQALDSSINKDETLLKGSIRINSKERIIDVNGEARLTNSDNLYNNIIYGAEEITDDTYDIKADYEAKTYQLGDETELVKSSLGDVLICTEEQSLQIQRADIATNNINGTLDEILDGIDDALGVVSDYVTNEIITDYSQKRDSVASYIEKYRIVENMANIPAALAEIQDLNITTTTQSAPLPDDMDRIQSRTELIRAMGYKYIPQYLTEEQTTIDKLNIYRRGDFIKIGSSANDDFVCFDNASISSSDSAQILEVNNNSVASIYDNVISKELDYYLVYIDFSKWSAPSDNGGGEWIRNNGGKEVKQIKNAGQTVFLSNDEYEKNLLLTGVMGVESGAGDDDYFGIVFGYKNSNDYYAVDWKKTTKE